MITSKVTSMGRTTVPQVVRAALGVDEGDDLAYIIEEGRAIMTKAPQRPERRARPLSESCAAFWEWDSPEDNEDFREL